MYGYLAALILAPALIWYGGVVTLPWIAASRRWKPMPLISSWGLQLAVAPALVGLIVGGVGGPVLSLAMPVLVPAAYSAIS